MPVKPVPDGYHSITPYLIVPDGAAAARAIAAGATLKRPVENQFYGDRLGTIIDPFGHIWHISTHIEDVSAEEIARRAEAAHRQATTGGTA